jgi:hypothetical protein
MRCERAWCAAANRVIARRDYRSRCRAALSFTLLQCTKAEAGSNLKNVEDRRDRTPMNTRSMTRAATVAALSWLVTACTSPPPPPAAPPATPFHTVYTVDDLMDYVITPAAEAYWGSVSIIIDMDGVTENFPTSDAEWESVLVAAITLAESGNLLMMPPRALGGDDWMRLSRDMVEAGVVAADAARAQDVDAVFDASEQVYNACQACHNQYLVDPAALTFPPLD